MVMKQPIEHLIHALHHAGASAAAEGFAASVKLARRTVPLHGFSLPENLSPIDAIGAKHFEMRAARRELNHALKGYDFQHRDAVITATTSVQIAEYQTYYWYGLAVGLVFTEARR